MIKLFEMGECVWAGETAKACLQLFFERMDDPDVKREMKEDGYPFEIPEKQWDSMKVKWDEGDEAILTYREGLQRLIKMGTKFPCEFSSEDY